MRPYWLWPCSKGNTNWLKPWKTAINIGKLPVPVAQHSETHTTNASDWPRAMCKNFNEMSKYHYSIACLLERNHVSITNMTFSCPSATGLTVLSDLCGYSYRLGHGNSVSPARDWHPHGIVWHVVGAVQFMSSGTPTRSATAYASVFQCGLPHFCLWKIWTVKCEYDNSTCVLHCALDNGNRK